MAHSGIHLRQGSAGDVEAVNRVIGKAVMSWNLPERVKRLSVPIYSYKVHDLDHLSLLLAEHEALGIIGVAAWEPASPHDLPGGQSGLLLHGLYVDPEFHRQGTGSQLLAAAIAAAKAGGYDGLLVKAQPDAIAFFQEKKLQLLECRNPERDYPYRLWMDLGKCRARPA